MTSFIAKVIPSNIRELEGALIRVDRVRLADEIADHDRPRRRSAQERRRAGPLHRITIGEDQGDRRRARTG